MGHHGIVIRCAKIPVPQVGEVNLAPVPGKQAILTAFATSEANRCNSAPRPHLGAWGILGQKVAPCAMARVFNTALAIGSNGSNGNLRYRGLTSSLLWLQSNGIQLC